MPRSAPAVTVDATAAPAVRAAAPLPEAQVGFFNQKGTTLTAATGTVESPHPGRAPDFHLQNLEDCTVALCETFGALKMEHLRNCTILCGPVQGSVYVESCHDCTIVVASRQIRIHNSVGCDFYVCTASGPIIEDCSGTRFAPYVFRYPALDKHMSEANLQTASTAWSDVKDFKWLRAQQSPNWCVLPLREALRTIPSPLAACAKTLELSVDVLDDGAGAGDDDDEEL